MLKKIKVRFIAKSKLDYELWPRPVLASANKPEWYQKLQSYGGGKVGIVRWEDNKWGINPNLKLCMPVHDVLTAGYHILLPTDIYIDYEQTSGQKKIIWSESIPAMVTTHHIEQIRGYPVREEYEPNPYKWANSWIIKTPPGWSCLIQHPAWHDHLPFRSLPAIVDTDKHDIIIMFPFLMQRSFTGLIPKGTPIVQVIPFKRQDIKATCTWDKTGEYHVKTASFFLTLFQKYKRFVRQPKNYELEEATEAPKCPFMGPPADKDPFSPGDAR